MQTGADGGISSRPVEKWRWTGAIDRPRRDWFPRSKVPYCQWWPLGVRGRARIAGARRVADGKKATHGICSDTMLTSTVENYLKSIYLEEQRAPGARASTGRLASALQVAPGTVTAMIKTLTESGLVSYEPYMGVSLTEAGRKLATHVLRRHRLIELFLVEIMGMDWSEVHQDAEVLEHAVSERLIERMDKMLGRPAVDPSRRPDPHGLRHR